MYAKILEFSALSRWSVFSPMKSTGLANFLNFPEDPNIHINTRNRGQNIPNERINLSKFKLKCNNCS